MPASALRTSALRAWAPRLACAWAIAHGAPLALAAEPVAGLLPEPIAAALAQSRVPAQSFALWIQPVDAATPVWSLNGDAGMNPASVFKLATTSAALDTFGPAWSWKTQVAFTGPVRQGVLHGSLVIRGAGDPSLVQERLWLLLRQVRDAGVHSIDGDIVLDHGAFAPATRAPGDFDGAPLEPYNAQPDGLLMNYGALVLHFVPDRAAGVAHVSVEPALAGFRVDETVPLGRAACDDWRDGLALQADDPAHWRFRGRYPAGCGTRDWPVAYSDPASFDRRLVAALWKDVGGRLKGQVRDGRMPADAQQAFEFASPPLAQVVRDINKYSNNVMAEQVYLSLAASADGADAATPDAARAALDKWLHERLGADADGIVIANGSGLARETRISARALGSLLQWVWRSPDMPELMGSLPLNGVDGTLRHAGATAGRAHLKSGSMRDVIAIAGFVLSDSGRRYVLVAIVNDPNAAAARPVFDAAIDWVVRGPVASPRP